jgi:hypothetical protein
MVAVLLNVELDHRRREKFLVVGDEVSTIRVSGWIDH